MTQPLPKIQGTQMTQLTNKKYCIDQDNLPSGFPTHFHNPEHWTCLGRVVGTFGFLEEILLKASFAFTATRPYAEDEIDEAYKKWMMKLEKSLSDPLGGLIDTFGKAVRDYPNADVEGFENLMSDLRQASKVRNALCHGSWRKPNSDGKALLFFINRQNDVFDTEIDCAFLDQLQRHAASLACAVMDTVGAMGLQFPGSNGPGVPIFKNLGT